MKPLLDVYSDMQHSYIIELKYAKGKETTERVAKLREVAILQANRYAATEMVQQSIGHTRLYKIVVVYHGMEMAVRGLKRRLELGDFPRTSFMWLR